MKILSWNVNSLRMRFDHLTEVVKTHQPEVIALQETKVMDDAFPLEHVIELGYDVVFSGQKTFNGTAVLSKLPITQVETAIPDFHDEQKRVLAATIGGVRLLNLYVPNGSEVGSEKFEYKLAWLNALQHWVAETLQQHKQVILVGDFNIAPADNDVHDPKAWHEKILCSPQERAALKALLDLGLTDAFRHLHPESTQYSWWDYRAGGYPRNQGLRIDHALVNQPLLKHCVQCTIDETPRQWDKPSDHASVVLTFDI